MDLREAAGTLGVHYQTAYGWVRQGVLPARKVGRGYEISEADAAELAARRRQGTEPARPIHVRDWAAQSRRLYQALAEGDETLAWQRLGRLSGGVPLIDLCAQVIGPALRRIGDDWAAGRVSIAQEHRASAGGCAARPTAGARRPAPPGVPRGGRAGRARAGRGPGLGPVRPAGGDQPGPFVMHNESEPGGRGHRGTKRPFAPAIGG